MPAINVNMYVEPTVELVPLYTTTGQFNDAQPITHTVPTGYPANSAITGEKWYIDASDVVGDGKLIIYVPNNGVINTFYVYTIGDWGVMSNSNTSYITPGTTVENGVNYNTYTYYDYTAIGNDLEPNTGQVVWSFGID